MPLVNFSSYEKQFLKFLETSSDYTAAQKTKIKNELQQDHIVEVFQLSVILLIWSFVMIGLESIITPTALTYAALYTPEVAYTPLVLLVLNASVKYAFIHWYTKGSLKVRVMLEAVIPYLGSGLLLAETLKDHPEFRSALKDFLKYKRKRKFKKIR